MPSEPTAGRKPLLRGHLHQTAFFISVGACALLITKSASSTAIIILSAIVYSIGLLMMFGTSALYHRVYWSQKKRALLKRMDHSAIYVMIAGSFTPVCLLALPKEQGLQLLTICWITAILGILQSNFWSTAPKYVSALLYVTMGWLVSPYISDLNESLGTANVVCLIVGGVIYTLGAIGYATKRPKLNPDVFGYHEFFHALTLVAATFHFIVIYKLIV